MDFSKYGTPIKTPQPEKNDFSKYGTPIQPLSSAQAQPQEQPEKPFYEKTSDFFGGKGIADLIGGTIAKATVPKEQRQYVSLPSPKQVAGSALQLGSLFIPVGGIAKGASLGLKSLGLGAKTASIGSKVIAGAATGYPLDVGMKLQEEKSLGEAAVPGLSTLVGGGIPLVPPISRGIGKLASESLGATTGTGGGVTRELFKSARTGGERATEALKAMRGQTSPEQIVETAKSALGTVIQGRTNAYKEQLAKLQTNVKEFDHTPVITKFNQMLKDFGVVEKDGVPDFSRSPGLGRYETDLRKISMVLKDWGTQAGDKTVVGIDKLKQVIDDFRIGSADSKKFDAFVTALRNESKNLINGEPGYDKLVKEYAESTGLIKEVQRSLSLGDKASTDTAFRKLSGALRVNNEFRKQLIQELDIAVPGNPLSSQIAGQQMSELLPRGIMRAVAGGGAVTGIVGGMGIMPLLKAAIFTSPRVVGELLYALGFTARQGDKIISVLKKSAPGDILLNRVTQSSGKTPRALPPSEIAPITSKPANITTKSIIPDTIPQTKSFATPRTLTGAGVGSLAGFEKDENGNIKYDTKKGALGALFGVGAVNYRGKPRGGLSIEDVSKGAGKKPLGSILPKAKAENNLLSEAKKYKTAEVKKYFGKTTDFVESNLQSKIKRATKGRPDIFVFSDESRISNSKYLTIQQFAKNDIEHLNDAVKTTKIRISDHDLPEMKYGSVSGDSDIYISTKDSGMSDNLIGAIEIIDKKHGISLAKIFEQDYKKGEPARLKAEQSLQRMGREIQSKNIREGLGSISHLLEKHTNEQAFFSWYKTAPKKEKMLIGNASFKITGKFIMKGSPEEYTRAQLTQIWQEAHKTNLGGILPKAKADTAQILRGTKGLTADDIMKTHPNIKLTKDVPATDIHGNKVIIPDGEKLTPYELKGNKILLQDGETYIVSKNQFENIKGQSVGGEAKPFAPELQGLEETVKGKKDVADLEAKWETKASEVNKAIKDYGATDKRTMMLRQERDILKDQISAATNKGTTKYSQYQLPGGKNYKEVLIKAPKDEIKFLDWKSKENGDLTATKNGRTFGINKEGNRWYIFEENGQLGNVNVGTLEQAKKSVLNEVNRLIPGNNFKSSHWDEPNVLAHLRLNERTYQGKKVAFMEELQSDWAREARAGKTDANNPNLKNWQELSVKRALKEAVDSKAEYFSWINGEQTSARYNLATHVDNVMWEKIGENKAINIVAKGGKRIDLNIDGSGIISDRHGGTPSDWKGKKLDEVLGKGLADKIMEKETGTLSGEGLKFGGEWASSLYDRQVKNIVQDLTGGKVEMLDLGLPIDGKAEKWIIADMSVNETQLTSKNISVGKAVYPRNSERNIEPYIITDILGDGKFKAVEKDVLKKIEDIKSFEIQTIRKQGTQGYGGAERRGQIANIEKLTPLEYAKKNNLSIPEDEKQSFDISQKTTTQQAVRLTKEIRDKINGIAPEIKTSGRMFTL